VRRRGETGKAMLSIELVPRDIDELRRQTLEVTGAFGGFSWLNIPDIRRLPVRSYEAALELGPLPVRTVPHVRARDRSVAETVALLRRLEGAGVRDVLIVTGDRFDHEEEAAHPTTLEVIAQASRELEAVNLWAAFDPYRSELKAELEYAEAKLEAGAKGLFTQPFFDPRFAAICLDQLDGVEVFVGITPVTSEKSARYWERQNRVVFPPGFEATLEACARLSVELMQLAREYGQRAYLMPIAVDPMAYLKAVAAAEGGEALLCGRHELIS